MWPKEARYATRKSPFIHCRQHQGATTADHHRDPALIHQSRAEAAQNEDLGAENDPAEWLPTDHRATAVVKSDRSLAELLACRTRRQEIAITEIEQIGSRSGND